MSYTAFIVANSYDFVMCQLSKGKEKVFVLF